MATRARLLKFGPFEADLHTGELRRDGGKLPLQEQPFRVLAALLERAGDLVTREELRRIAWSPDVFVDFEHGLNKAVNKIRRALGDDPEVPTYLETLPGRGYRFIAVVEADGQVARGARRRVFRVLWDARTIALGEGENVIGRDPETSVWVDSVTVSRRHACIRVTAGTATLEDLGSKNGTYLRGQRVERPAELCDGDEIAVGSARLTFRAPTAETTRTASG